MARSSIERIVVQRLAHQLVTERLVDRVYNQPLIGNVERGAYVECMIELALSELRPPWRLTSTWAGWDLEQAESRGTDRDQTIRRPANLERAPGRGVAGIRHRASQRLLRRRRQRVGGKRNSTATRGSLRDGEAR